MKENCPTLNSVVSTLLMEADEEVFMSLLVSLSLGSFAELAMSFEIWLVLLGSPNPLLSLAYQVGYWLNYAFDEGRSLFQVIPLQCF